MKNKKEEAFNTQMKIIGQLQEEIKLLKFDKSRNLEKIRTLEKYLKMKNDLILNVREELETMKRLNDYSRITNVLKYFKGVNDEN